MCLAVPGKVISIEGGTGLIDFSGVKRKASLELLDNVSVGEYVIVHAGCAIERLDEEEALKTIMLFKELSGELDEGFDAEPISKPCGEPRSGSGGI